MEVESLDGLYQSSPKDWYKNYRSFSIKTQFSIKWTYNNFGEQCEVLSLLDRASSW